MGRSDYIDRSNDISCQRAGELIPGYLNRDLRPRDMRCLLKHLRTCTRCREELETNFMIQTTIQYMNTDINGSMDLKQLFRDDLRQQEEALIRSHRTRGTLICIAIVTLILLTLTVMDITGLFHITVFFDRIF